jgi:hypothetical protein
MNLAWYDLPFYRGTYPREEIASAFSGVYTDHPVIESSEIGPPNTANPTWVLVTYTRLRELAMVASGASPTSIIPLDTLAYALTLLAQVLPPTAPPPSVSAPSAPVLLFTWDTGQGRVDLEISKPNEVLFRQPGKVIKASADLRLIGELLWDQFRKKSHHDQAAGERTKSSLAGRIQRLRDDVFLEPASEKQADAAISDAVEFVQRELPDGRPRVQLTEDGVITLQWRNEDVGVLMVFAGGGTVTYSIRTPGTSYASGARELSLQSPLPDELLRVIRIIDGA